MACTAAPLAIIRTDFLGLPVSTSFPCLSTTASTLAFKAFDLDLDFNPHTIRQIDGMPNNIQKNVAYKKAASRYTRVMIALPIMIVTSYYLFDRLALGHEAKTLHRIPVEEAGGQRRNE